MSEFEQTEDGRYILTAEQIGRSGERVQDRVAGRPRRCASQGGGRMTAMQHEDMTVLEMVEDHEIPCDYSDWTPQWNHGDPAAWVAHARCVSCMASGKRLICTKCKDMVMTTDAGVKCPSCEEVHVPARHAYERFEPL